MTKLIINADDFGINKDVNSAIMAAMDSNLCRDTTLLVNFEESEHAAGLAISSKRKNNIGIHFNLTEGYPLTSKIKNEDRFCNKEGLFHYKKDKRIFRLSNSEKIAVYEELRSQIHLCRKFGIPVSHADSHNHIHEEPGLLFIFIEILKKEAIPFIRLSNNMGETTFINAFYRMSFNTVLRLNKLNGTDYFGSTSNLNHYKNTFNTNDVIELMIHPGQLKNNQVIDVYSNENLSIQLPLIIREFKMMSYSEILYK